MTRDEHSDREHPAADGSQGSDSPSAPRLGSNDVGLIAALRGMWQRRDPVPVGLVESVLARIAGSELDDEYEMLTLVESTERLAGVRGSAETRNLTFSSDTATVMLRVSELPGRRRRLDGWVSPPAILAVRVSCAGEELSTTSNANGRFEVADVPAGTATVRLLAPEPGLSGAAGQEPVRLTTPQFTL